MLTDHLQRQGIISMGLGCLLGGVIWLHTLAAQSDTRKSGNMPPVAASPSTSPQERDNLDYKNAQPMPLPSLPVLPLTIPPQTVPSPGGMAGHPGHEAGSTGTGETSPQSLVPPQRLPDLAPSNDAGTMDKPVR